MTDKSQFSSLVAITIFTISGLPHPLETPIKNSPGNCVPAFPLPLPLKGTGNHYTNWGDVTCPPV